MRAHRLLSFKFFPLRNNFSKTFKLPPPPPTHPIIAYHFHSISVVNDNIRATYNLRQNKWNIWTTPPPHFNDAKMARFRSFAPSSLLWGGRGLVVPFYSVQDCRSLSLLLERRRLDAWAAKHVMTSILIHVAPSGSPKTVHPMANKHMKSTARNICTCAVF